jgi:NAD(P)-dependent dehydrogenase (short-subunit alcohol dehydrogenase family)
VLAVRNVDKGNEAAARIADAAPGVSVAVQKLDLSSLESVRAAADELRSTHDTIDLLINNAGVMMTRSRRPRTASNCSSAQTISATSRSPACCSIGCCPCRVPRRHREQRRPPLRRNGINFDDLQSEKNYGRIAAYGQAKLANLMFTYELQRRLQGTNTIAAASHPGGSRTELARNLPLAVRVAEGVLATALPGRRHGRSAHTARGDRRRCGWRPVLRPRRIR